MSNPFYMAGAPQDMGPMRPLAKTGDFLGVFVSSVWVVQRVLGHGNIPGSYNLVKDLGAINAAAASASTDLAGITARQNELLQLRFAPIDDIEFELFLPSGNSQTALQGGVARVDKLSWYIDPYYALTEFYVAKQNVDAYMVGHNHSASNQSTARVKFWGYRFSLSDPVALDQVGFLAKSPPQAQPLVAPWGVMGPAQARALLAKIIYVQSDAGSAPNVPDLEVVAS